MSEEDEEERVHHHVNMEAAKKLHKFMAEQPEETMLSYAAALIREMRKVESLQKELLACEEELDFAIRDKLAACAQRDGSRDANTILSDENQRLRAENAALKERLGE